MKFTQLSVKWKIITSTVFGPLVIALIFGYLRVSDIRNSAIESMVNKSRAIVMMAEAGRNEMASKLSKGIMQPFHEIPKDKLLEAVPVVTAMSMVQKNTDSAGFSFRVPKVSPRNPANEPTAFEREILDELKSTNSTEKVVVTSDEVRYFRPIRLTSECLTCHGTSPGGKDPLGGPMEGWKTGEIHGAFEIIMSLDETNAHIMEAKMGVGFLTAGTLAIVLFVTGFMTRRTLLKPLIASADLTKQIEAGDLTAQVEVKSKDEMGQMMLRLNGMVQRLGTMMREIGSEGNHLVSASTGLQNISDTLSRSSETTADKSQTVAAASEEMSVNMNSVAAAVEQTATNVSFVSEAAEQMTVTINEIAQST